MARVSIQGGFGPLAASAWAQMMMRYWQRAHERGGLDVSQPLQVLDLVPGRATAVWMQLRALSELFSASFPDGPALRYCACTPDGELPAAWREAPELRGWIRRRVLTPLRWNPGVDLPAAPTNNPLVVLARCAWSRLEQRLLAVHYGELLEAKLELLAVEHDENTNAWTPISAEPWPRLQPVLDGYRARLNSAPIPLPFGAMRTIDQLPALASAGYLLLALDEGCMSELQMRLLGFDRVTARFKQHGMLPVNFHLLEAQLRENAVAVWQRALACNRTLQVAIAPAAGDSAQQALDHVIGQADCGPPSDSLGLADSMRTIAAHGSSEQALSLLRHAQHDPDVFAAAGPALHTRCLAEPECDRAGWRDALARIWGNQICEAGEPALHHNLVVAAMHSEAWGLAKRILRRGMRTHGQHPVALAQLAWCEMRTGRLARAQDLAAQALATDPGNAHAVEVLRRLELKLSRHDGDWRRPLGNPTLPFSLEPLDVEHAAAFHRQYRDPQIAVMTGLPPLATLEAVRSWIGRTDADPRRREYAVMHNDAGFVGYVSLELSQTTAYLCFWTGVDHQGQGLATEAARLLCRWALTRGMDWVFASAFDDNQRSIRALERVGFVRLGVRPASADDPRTFLCYGARDAAWSDATRAFIDYLHNEQPDMALVANEDVPAGSTERTS